jgi:anti-sigma factor RsiW
MTTRHPDEGAIQAYLDGELAAEAAAAAEAHFAHCAACAEALREARAEAALFATAFALDESMTVPTEVLRARLGAAIAQLEDAVPANGSARQTAGRESLFAPLRRLFAFTPQRGAAFASLLAVVAFTVIFAVTQRQQSPQSLNNGGQIAEADATPTPTLGQPPPAAVSATNPAETDEIAAVAQRSAPVRVANSGGRDRISVVNSSVERLGRRREKTDGTLAKRTQDKTPADAGREVLLPGEENYRQAIASLSKAVELGGDAVMTPKARFEYERNLALLDSAISETRRVAIRDPKDKEAVSFLLAAYQSKVDLLTTVADQAQVAALGR